MLAAATKEASVKDAFYLVLSLSRDSEKDIPDSLIRLFDEILNQAKSIAKSETPDLSKIHPEAIALALEIKSAEKFSSYIDKVESFDALTPDLANNILIEMENFAVY